MKRFIVHFEKRLFAEWVWAESMAAARKQMQPYAHSIGDRITKVEEA